MFGVERGRFERAANVAPQRYQEVAPTGAEQCGRGGDPLAFHPLEPVDSLLGSLGYILRATGDIRKVSLWLGHADIRTTEVHLRASPMEKLEILAAHTPPEIRPGAFPGAQDSLMRLLNGM